MRLRPSDSRKKSSSSTRTIRDAATGIMVALRDELLETSVPTTIDSVIGANLVVEDTRHLTLQIEIEIEVGFAAGPDIAPDRGGSRLVALRRLAEKAGDVALRHADELL